MQHGISRGSGPVVRSEEARQRELQQIAQYTDLVELVKSKVRLYFGGKVSTDDIL
jgi:geranylgeranyl transferase type-2 subunit alpha